MLRTDLYKQPPIEPLAIPLPQAPAVTGLSRSGIYRAAAEGHIRLMKAGRMTLVDLASVRAYLAKLPTLMPKATPGIAPTIPAAQTAER